MVLEGRLERILSTDQGREVSVGSIDPGEFCGTAEVLDTVPHPASIHADGRVIVLEFQARALADLLQVPGLVQILYAQARRSLIDMTALMYVFVLTDLEARLAHYVLHRARRRYRSEDAGDFFFWSLRKAWPARSMGAAPM